MRLGAILTLVAVLSIGGCGESEPDVGEAEETAISFWDAIAKGERSAACDLTGDDFSDTCDEDVRTISRDEVADAFVARSGFDSERSTAYVSVCIPSSSSLAFVPALTNVEFVQEDWRIQGFVIGDPDDAVSNADRRDLREAAKTVCGDRMS